MNRMYTFSFSERGYNHIKSNKVCQDDSGHYSDDSMSIIVVADGHGSNDYPRTDRGARYAVESAITAIREFVKTAEDCSLDIAEDYEAYMEQLAKNILAKWHAAVDTDLTEYSFSEEELSNVSETYKKRYLSGEKAKKAYGTTLIAVCQTKKYWFGLQIGDGKCVCISPNGTVYESIPWDDACQANITTSICDPNAIAEFRFGFTTNCPTATFMGTDGVDDSYRGPEELYNLYRGFLTIFAEHGREIGEREIQEYLPEASHRGSGDDISIAGLVSAGLSASFISMMKAQCEYSIAKERWEDADREIVFAEEKREYIQSALEKATRNYEMCRQRANDANEAVKAARLAKEEARTRYEAAEAALSSAIDAYQRSIVACQMPTDGVGDAVDEIAAVEQIPAVLPEETSITTAEADQPEPEKAVDDGFPITPANETADSEETPIILSDTVNDVADVFEAQADVEITTYIANAELVDKEPNAAEAAPVLEKSMDIPAKSSEQMTIDDIL